MIREFVVVYAYYKEPATNLDEILVIHKDRPSAQRGRFNLPGGKIEPEEQVEAAAVRELFEETGLKALGSVDCVGKIVGTWGLVHCVKVKVEHKAPVPRD